jgi:thiol:disulfide interchange protein DsbA
MVGSLYSVLHRLATPLLLALCMCAAAVDALAQNRPIQAGREYTRLSPPRPVATGSRIEVVEFFYYGCPICYEFQPHFSRWLFQAPEYVALRRVPALSSENWEAFARLFYTLDTLGELNRLHWPIYDNFHFDGIKLNDEKTMVEWIARNGIDRQKFLTAYNSEDVKKMMAQSRDMMKHYDVRAVPTVVVDGKYMTSARLAGGTRQLAQVVNELVKLARKERPN